MKGRPVDTLALPLEPSPRSVQLARRWVTDACARMGRRDLLESAELGVSELVTNALLHAEPPLAVRVRGTRDHPRIEVHDGSCTAPTPPEDQDAADLALGSFLGELADLVDPGDLAELGDVTDVGARAGALRDDQGDTEVPTPCLLSNQGRGLGIVARVSAAWGADVDRDGKVVWFEPAPESGGGPSRPVFAMSDDAVHPPAADVSLVPVTVLGLPVRAYATFLHHFRELRRELRLLSLAHEAQYPMAKELSALFADFEAQLTNGMATERLETALAAGDESVDLPVQVPVTVGEQAAQVLQLLDLADTFCRDERLLCLARTPQQEQFQRWFLGEFVRQAAGAAPVRWVRSRSIAGSAAS